MKKFIKTVAALLEASGAASVSIDFDGKVWRVRNAQIWGEDADPVTAATAALQSFRPQVVSELAEHQARAAGQQTLLDAIDSAVAAPVDP